MIPMITNKISHTAMTVCVSIGSSSLEAART